MADYSSAEFLNRQTPPHISTLILLSGLSALSMNIFLPSLPGMAAYFQTDYYVMQLSVAIYLAVNAALQIVVGPISDKLGRRPVILWGTVLFMLATLGCLYATSIEAFLAFRMMQAIIVVGIVLSRAVVRDIVAGDKAASMISYVTMGMAIVPMAGPAVGGVIDQIFGWQANFWLLFGLGAAILALAWVDLGETKSRSGLSLARQFREYPELLMSPRFWGYALSSAFASGAFFSYLGGAPYVGTEVFGMDAATLGFYFGAPALGYVIGNYISGRYAIRFGLNRMVFWGCVITAAGVGVSLLIFLIGHGTAISFFGFMTFVGIGNGMTIPNATAGALSVRPHLAGTASGLAGAIMIGGGAAFSALAGAMLTEGSGATPLLWLMLISSLFGIGSIAAVLIRARQIGL